MSNSSSISVYIDESGSDILANSNSNDRFYVSVGVIVQSEDVKSVNDALEEISKQFNSGAEFKSSRIAKDNGRRLDLLRRFRDLRYNYVALAIDKKKIDKDSAYKYRTVYYKNFNKHLYQRIARAMSGHADFIIDSHGTKDYEDSAVKYFDKHCDMFHDVRFKYVNDKSERLVQVADIIAGSIRQMLVSGFAKEYSAIRKELRGKEISLMVLPRNYSDPTTSTMPITADSEIDKKCGKDT